MRSFNSSNTYFPGDKQLLLLNSICQIMESTLIFFVIEQDFDTLFNYFEKISLEFGVLGRLGKGKFLISPLLTVRKW